MTDPQNPTQTAEPEEVLMAGIENAVMGAFSDGYDAARGEGATRQNAVDRLIKIQERVRAAIRAERQAPESPDGAA